MANVGKPLKRLISDVARQVSDVTDKSKGIENVKYGVNERGEKGVNFTRNGVPTFMSEDTFRKRYGGIAVKKANSNLTDEERQRRAIIMSGKKKAKRKEQLANAKLFQLKNWQDSNLGQAWDKYNARYKEGLQDATRRQAQRELEYSEKVKKGLIPREDVSRNSQPLNTTRRYVEGMSTVTPEEQQAANIIQKGMFLYDQNSDKFDPDKPFKTGIWRNLGGSESEPEDILYSAVFDKVAKDMVDAQSRAVGRGIRKSKVYFNPNDPEQYEEFKGVGRSALIEALPTVDWSKPRAQIFEYLSNVVGNQIKTYLTQEKTGGMRISKGLKGEPLAEDIRANLVKESTNKEDPNTGLTLEEQIEQPEIGWKENNDLNKEMNAALKKYTERKGGPTNASQIIDRVINQPELFTRNSNKANQGFEFIKAHEVGEDIRKNKKQELTQDEQFILSMKDNPANQDNLAFVAKMRGTTPEELIASIERKQAGEYVPEPPKFNKEGKALRSKAANTVSSALSDLKSDKPKEFQEVAEKYNFWKPPQEPKPKPVVVPFEPGKAPGQEPVEVDTSPKSIADIARELELTAQKYVRGVDNFEPPEYKSGWAPFINPDPEPDLSKNQRIVKGVNYTEEQRRDIADIARAVSAGDIAKDKAAELIAKIKAEASAPRPQAAPKTNTRSVGSLELDAYIDYLKEKHGYAPEQAESAARQIGSSVERDTDLDKALREALEHGAAKGRGKSRWTSGAWKPSSRKGRLTSSNP